MNDGTAEKVKAILTSLLSLTRDDIGDKSSDAFALRKFQDEFLRLYEEDGIIASLTHSVLCNKGSAHSFCVALHRLGALWDHKEVMLSFAEGLRKGDSLLIDGISFIPKYRHITEIQEAIAYNIATCSSILFQLNFIPSFGLIDHPSIKKAILERTEDILRMIQKNWHESVFVVGIPYLMEDNEIGKFFDGLKPNLLQSLKQDESLVDFSYLLKNVDWVQNDTDIIDSIRDRFITRPFGLDYVLPRELKNLGRLERYSELQDAVGDWIKD